MCSMLCTPCVACQLLGETEKRGPIHDHWREGSNRANVEQPWKFGMFNCFDDCTTCESHHTLPLRRVAGKPYHTAPHRNSLLG